MKGEYVEPQNEGENPNNMFSKPHHPFSPHSQLTRDSQTPASDDTPKRPTTILTGGSGGASVEVIRRRRGRPPGSKNKPKSPLIITREPHPYMSACILEIPGGNDVVEAISGFSRLKNFGICVLTGSGAVSDVTLFQPSTTSAPATITFRGRFDMLSLSATFLPQTTSCHVPNTFSISLAGHQGQIIGGFVAGSLVAAATVFVVAATINNPTYHRLPGEEEKRNTVSSAAAAGDGKGQSPPLSSGGGGTDSRDVPMYSCHMGTGSDVIWAPTARPQPPPPPY